LYVGFCVEGVKHLAEGVKHLAQGVKHFNLPYPRIISKIKQGKRNQRKRAWSRATVSRLADLSSARGRRRSLGLNNAL
jgi:hypothetical protein